MKVQKMRVVFCPFCGHPQYAFVKDDDEIGEVTCEDCKKEYNPKDYVDTPAPY